MIFLNHIKNVSSFKYFVSLSEVEASYFAPFDFAQGDNCTISFKTLTIIGIWNLTTWGLKVVFLAHKKIE
ncbi:hypothetical protein B0A63_00020 [Flavobacterium johnsoniae UW101]|nr:hypothetical protein B0A63_00020 [Flavobacterium johnsoniae UW101]